MNTIEDFRGWRSAEAAHRTRGCIRRLNVLQTTRLGVRSWTAAFQSALICRKTLRPYF